MLVTLFPISTLVKPLQYEKRFLPDARNAVRDRDARQATATPKCILPDTRNAVRDRDARQAATTPKRIIPDALNAVSYRDARQAAATPKRILPDTRNAVSYRDARQARAARKRTLPDTRNAVSYRYARQAAAIVQCIISNSGNTRSNYNLFNCIIILPRRTTIIRIIVHFPFSGYCKHPVIVKCPREESSTLSRRFCP